MPLQPTSQLQVPSPFSPSLQRPFLHWHSAEETHVRMVVCSCVSWFQLILNQFQASTLVAVDSIFAALAGFTGCPVEALVALTDPRAAGAVRTGAVTRAGLTVQTRTRLAVFPKKPAAAPSLLQTQNTLVWALLTIVRVTFISAGDGGGRRTTFSFRQVALQPVLSIRSPLKSQENIHLLDPTFFCTEQKE